LKVGDQAMRPLWPTPQRDALMVIDQRVLPHRLLIERLATPQAVFTAIRDMWVRGAPLIGATAAYGLALQMSKDATDASLSTTVAWLNSARPTAVNLAWALQRMQRNLLATTLAQRPQAAWDEADAIAEDDVRVNHAIGQQGLPFLQTIAARNAMGLPLHVWVDETRPRNQGASLTAWELGQAGVPHTLVADNAGGHLMQHGQVDICIVGCDRVTAQGDVCNKIGTYLKALAAIDNHVPFYVAMPTSTLDMTLTDGLKEIPIEERSGREVTHLSGRNAAGEWVEVQISAEGTKAANPAFDVTPARLVSGLITEHGVVGANAKALRELMQGQV
jgi:methylthioribose-1-phosphate isomerase